MNPTFGSDVSWDGGCLCGLSFSGIVWCTDGDEWKEFRGILIEGIERFSSDGPMSFN